MIHCPRCDSSTPRLLSREYDDATRTTTRVMMCPHGHRFVSKEVPARLIAPERERTSALSAIARRVGLFQRDRAIQRDARPISDIAADYGLTRERVRQIRASG